MQNSDIDSLIEELINKYGVSDLIEEMEKESIQIDPNVIINKSSTHISKDLYDVNVENKRYELSLDWMLLSNKKMFVDINFKLKNLKQIKNLKSSNDYIETGITGTGDAKKVFDKIVSTIIKLVSEKNPSYITFQAREDRRKNLYKYMIRQVLRKMGEYKQIETSPITNESIEDGEFWLEKI